MHPLLFYTEVMQHLLLIFHLLQPLTQKLLLVLSLQVQITQRVLSDPFNPRLERYTQRNLGLIFKMITYQGQNPGITEIIKKMPEALIPQQVETFEDADGDEQELLPLASNIDNYNM